MLAKILKICAAHLEVEPCGRLGGTCRSVVQRFRLGIKHNPPSCPKKTMAPVNIFAIHKELFIQSAYLLQRNARNHPEPAGKHFDIVYLVVWITIHQEAAERFRIWKDTV